MKKIRTNFREVYNNALIDKDIEQNMTVDDTKGNMLQKLFFLIHTKHLKNPW